MELNTDARDSGVRVETFTDQLDAIKREQGRISLNMNLGALAGFELGHYSASYSA